MTRVQSHFGQIFPFVEPTPELLPITDPANLSPDAPPAVQKAAEIKSQEDQAPQKIKALRYLATIGCGGCYVSVEDAFLAALDDCTESVRYEAIKAIRGTTTCSCSFCNQDACCSKKIREKLTEMAFEMSDDGLCYKEPSERVRRVARLALNECGPAVEVPEAPEPEPAVEPEIRPEEGPEEGVEMASAIEEKVSATDVALANLETKVAQAVPTDSPKAAKAKTSNHDLAIDSQPTALSDRQTVAIKQRPIPIGRRQAASDQPPVVSNPPSANRNRQSGNQTRRSKDVKQPDVSFDPFENDTRRPGVASKPPAVGSRGRVAGNARRQTSNPSPPVVKEHSADSRPSPVYNRRPETVIPLPAVVGQKPTVSKPTVSSQPIEVSDRQPKVSESSSQVKDKQTVSNSGPPAARKRLPATTIRLPKVDDQDSPDDSRQVIIVSDRQPKASERPSPVKTQQPSWSSRSPVAGNRLPKSTTPLPGAVNKASYNSSRVTPNRDHSSASKKRSPAAASQKMDFNSRYSVVADRQSTTAKPSPLFDGQKPGRESGPIVFGDRNRTVTKPSPSTVDQQPVSNTDRLRIKNWKPSINDLRPGVKRPARNSDQVIQAAASSSPDRRPKSNAARQPTASLREPPRKSNLPTPSKVNTRRLPWNINDGMIVPDR